MEYTKGKWKAEGLQVASYGAGIIAQCPTPQMGGVFECVANARLIAAAPDMYEALRDVLLLHGEDFDTLHRGIGTATFRGKSLLAAREALAKAEGKED